MSIFDQWRHLVAPGRGRVSHAGPSVFGDVLNHLSGVVRYAGHIAAAKELYEIFKAGDITQSQFRRIGDLLNDVSGQYVSHPSAGPSGTVTTTIEGPGREAKKRKFGDCEGLPMDRVVSASMRWFRNDMGLEVAHAVGPPVTHSAGVAVFSANGIWQPYAGVGHSACGFNEFMVMYGRYGVIRSKVTAWLNNTNAEPVTVGITLCNNVTPSLNSRTYIESGCCKYTTIGSLTSGGENPKCVTLDADISRFLGRPDLMSEDSTHGTATSNPSEACFFHVWVDTLRAVATSWVWLTVQIDFDVVFTEPLRLPSSG